MGWRSLRALSSSAPALIYGDSDMIRPEHIVEFYQKLGGGLKDAGWMREHMSKNRLAILPGRARPGPVAEPRAKPSEAVAGE